MKRWVSQNAPHGQARNASVFLGSFWTYPIDLVPTLLLFFNIVHSGRKIIFLGISQFFEKKRNFQKSQIFNFAQNERQWRKERMCMI